MEKLLGNLQNHLNETLLKEAEFTIHSKQAVLEAVREKEKAGTHTQIWKQGLSIGFTAFLFAGVLVFAASFVGEGPAQMNNTSGDNTLNESPPIHSRDAVYQDDKENKGEDTIKKAIKPEPSKAFSAKGEPEKVMAAIENVRNTAGPFYELIEKETEPVLVSYSEEHGMMIMLSYRLIKYKDKMVFVTQFHNNKKYTEYPASRFSPKNHRNFKKPRLINTYLINDLKWAYYEDLNQEDNFYVGYGPKWTMEVSFQGSIDEEQISNVLRKLK